MKRTIKLLEERVAQAARRLNELRTERDGIRDELAAVRLERVRAGKKRPGDARRTKGRRPPGEPTEWIAELRDVIRELRDE